MRFFIISISILFGSICCKAQEFILEESVLDSIYSYNADLGESLYRVYKYNRLVKLVGKTDTVKVFRNKDKFAFTIGGSSFDGHEKFIDQDGLFSLISNNGKDLMLLRSSTYLSDTTYYSIAATATKPNGSVRLNHYKFGLPFGSYKKYDFSGVLLEEGQYMFKDSTYSDTITTFHYETYEERVEIIHHKYVEMKCGPWIKRDSTGVIIETVQNVKCN